MMTKPKTKAEAKVNPKIDFMLHWKDEEKCYEDAKMEGFKDEKSDKKAEGRWPRDKPMAQVYYEEWLKKVQNPDTGQFYNKKDNYGNIIKGTGPST